MKKEKRFVASPYMLVMAVVLMIGCMGVVAGVFFSGGLSVAEVLQDSNEMQFYTFFFSLIFMLYLTLFCIRYEWATIVEIQEDRLLFKALFTRRSFYYKDMHYIGVDYGVLQGSKQFWIYFSEKEIPMKYYHRINRLKFTKDCMRVQYYKKAYNKLVEHTPPEISKQLRKCYSTVLLYKLDDED